MAGFYILPALLKTYLPRIIEQETGKKASIERVEFQPFNLAIALQGLHIQEESHETTGIGFDDFYLQLNLFQSFHQWAIVIDEVSLKKPFVHLARQKNGVLNVTELIKNKAEPKKPETSSSVKFYITKLSLIDGTLVWDDFSAKEPFTSKTWRRCTNCICNVCCFCFNIKTYRTHKLYFFDLIETILYK